MRYRLTLTNIDDIADVEEYSFEDKETAMRISRLLNMIPRHTVNLESMRENSLGRLEINVVDYRENKAV